VKGKIRLSLIGVCFTLILTLLAGSTAIAQEGNPPITLKVGNVDSTRVFLPLALKDYPESGIIAFTSDRINYSNEIFTMNSDGRGVTRLTYNNADDAIPDWSPDGSKIAFESDRSGTFEIYVMNADGSNQTRVTTIGNCYFPRWSPDGTRIAFYTNQTGLDSIYTINPNGTGVFQVTSPEVEASDPAWSPDGTKIGFISAFGSAGISAINANGTNQSLLYGGDFIYYFDWGPDGKSLAISQNYPPNYKWQIHVFDLVSQIDRMLTDTTWNNFGVRWSPSGTNLVFYAGTDTDWEIYTMDKYGYNLRNISNNPAHDTFPDWKP
jgi:Tol biopolymer transport system component